MSGKRSVTVGTSLCSKGFEISLDRVISTPLCVLVCGVYVCEQFLMHSIFSVISLITRIIFARGFSRKIFPITDYNTLCLGVGLPKYIDTSRNRFHFNR